MAPGPKSPHPVTTSEETHRIEVQSGAYIVQRVLASKVGMSTKLATRLLNDKTDQAVIIKTFDQPLFNEALWRRYATIDNPHLPKLIDMFEHEGRMFVVLEYVPGEDLHDYVARKGRLEVHEAVRIQNDLCEADAALSATGIVHRDIKPSNVILSFDGASLIDPGIARIAGVGESKRHDTIILGSLGYASPEQVGFAETTAQSDVFSLGRVLGFMLCATSPTERRYHELLHDPAFVPAPLAAFVDRCCALEPSSRPMDATQLQSELMQALYASETSRSDDSRGWFASARQPRVDAPPNPLRPPSMRPAQASIDYSLSPAIGTYTPSHATHRGVAWAVAIVALVFGALFCIEGFFSPSQSLPPWGNIIYGLSMGVLGNFAAGYEIVSFLLLRGNYERDPAPRARCVKRVAIWWGVCFGILVATSGLARVIS